ncbi:glycosyltransferase family 4 protein [Labilibacter sediminis]|nr:glycosyltransferase family 4 protein [Labilibacter sediminis]
MKVLINCSTLKKGGVLQVAHSFVGELLNRTDHEYYIVFSSLLKKDFPELQEDNQRFFVYDIKPTIVKAITGRDKRLDEIADRIKPDIVFSLFGPTYWHPKSLHVCGYAKASYFYPDSPFIQNMPIGRKLKLMFLKQLHLYDFKRFNDALITETEDASRRLSGLLPAKNIYTVSNTYNQIFNSPEKWDRSVKLPDFIGVTLLSITANYRHKNLKVIPAVISYLKVKYPDFKFRFVLTLNKGDINFPDTGINGHVLYLGRVDIYQCPPLYENSDFMFMPTLLECFSATYPEAMKMGVPVLTSDMPFARTVCGDAAIYFDPMSPENIAESIYKLASNNKLRSEITEKGTMRLQTFNDAKSRTQKYIEILEKTYKASRGAQ